MTTEDARRVRPGDTVFYHHRPEFVEDVRVHGALRLFKLQGVALEATLNNRVRPDRGTGYVSHELCHHTGDHPDVPPNTEGFGSRR